MGNINKRVQKHRCKVMLALSVIIVTALTAHFWITKSVQIAQDSDRYYPLAIQENSKSYLGSLLFASREMHFDNALKSIKIEPNIPKGIIIHPQETLRLTAVGVFATWEQQINAYWSLLRGTSSESLHNCNGSRSCLYTAGNTLETVRIRAESDGKSDEVTVKIEEALNSVFVDELPGWAASSIAELNQLGIIRGYDDGRYGAADVLTRSQVITLLYRILLHANLENSLIDCNVISSRVPENHYAYLPLCLFHANGWEAGWNFNPDDQISRGETAAYINRVFGPAFMNALNTMQGAIYIDGQIFSDVPTDHEYFYDTGVANKAVIMTGNPDGTFGVDRTLNRAEAATVIYRILNQVETYRIRSL